MTTKTKNQVITPCGMFATPESIEALQEYIKNFSGSEAVVANTIMGMTWNLCSKLIEEDE